MFDLKDVHCVSYSDRGMDFHYGNNREAEMDEMRGTKECPGCAMPVPADAHECPYCHYEFPGQKSSLKWVALLVLLAFLLPLLVLLRKLLTSLLR